MNQFKMRVALFPEEVYAIFGNNGDISGLDGFFTLTAATQMNAKIEINRNFRSIGMPFRNGTVTGSLKAISERTVDFSFNSHLLKSETFALRAENTYPFSSDDLCFLVANSGYASQVTNMFRTFDKNVWISMLGILFLVSYVWFKISEILENDKVRVCAFLQILRVNINQNLPRTPDVISLRILLIIWGYFCLLTTNTFLGNLTSTLLLRNQLPNIDTLVQLDESNLLIKTNLRNALDLRSNLNKSIPTHKRLLSRIIESSDDDIYFLTRSGDTNFAYLERRHTVRYHTLNRRTPAGRPIYHEVKQCPVPYLTVYIAPFGSPYLGHINRLLGELRESGLTNYWDTIMRANLFSRRRQIVQMDEENRVIKLTIVHLQMAFYILFAGLTISTIVFILELRNAAMIKNNKMC